MSEQSQGTWLTQEAYDRLSAELEHRKTTERKEIAQRVEAARQEGDLRENAGYHAAREEAGLNEARIIQLEETLENAQIGEAADDGSVSAGTIVTAKVAGKEQVFALGGQEITSLNEKELAALRLTRFGFVFQQAHLMTTLCLLDNIVLPGFLAGLRPRSEVTSRGEELMERMGIADLAASGVTEVSGGQLQRASICRALINDPGIVFADEPTGALNSTTALQILDLLGEIHASGTTLVMVTHDSQVAARADRVLVLVDGRIMEDLSLGRYEAVKGPSRLETITEALQRRSV